MKKYSRGLSLDQAKENMMEDSLTLSLEEFIQELENSPKGNELSRSSPKKEDKSPVRQAIELLRRVEVERLDLDWGKFVWGSAPRYCFRCRCCR